jgi:hypothetical protein
MKSVGKIEICTEKLLIWAYQDELSKRQTSAAEGIWDRILQDGQRGGIDPGHGAAQRYAHFGLPDPDAEMIEKAVGQLEDTVIDWEQSFDAIAAELSALISVNDMAKREAKPKQTESGWGKAGTKALKVWWGPEGAKPYIDPPRDILMLGGLRTSALVTMHAVRGTRPDWIEDSPEPSMVPALKGPNAMIVGDCRGRNLYSTGAYCPLKYEPSPMSIVSSRAEYVAWHNGLTKLSQTLILAKFIPLAPKASQTPWLEIESEQLRSVKPVMPTTTNHVGAWGTLPLAPARGRMGPALRNVRAGPVRYPLEEVG